MAVCPLSRDQIADMIDARDNYVTNVVRTATGITVTRRDGVVWNVPIEEHDITFTETPDEYIITIDNVPHVITKCNRIFIDCDDNYIDPCVDHIVTCDNLAAENFIKNVCTNISLTGNGTVGNCLSVNWDNLCPNAESLATPPADAQVLICTGGAIKKVPVDEVGGGFDGCLNIPSLGLQCGVTQQLVAVQDPNDATCWTLARYVAAASRVVAFGSDSVYGDTHNMMMPTDITNSAAYYSYSDLSADAAASTINATKLNATKIATATFAIPCAGQYEVNMRSLTNFDPTQNGGAGTDSRIVFRFDGVFELSPTNLIVDSINPFTNFVASIDNTIRKQLTAGNHTVEAFIVRDRKPQAAQLRLTSTPVGGGNVSRSNTITISKAVG